MWWFLRLSGVSAALAIALAFSVGFGGGQLHAGEERKALQLEVIVNNVPANIIGSFVMFSDGRIGASRKELDELGIQTDSRRLASDIISLDEIQGLKYEYEERTQKIIIKIDDAARKLNSFDLRNNANELPVRAQAGWGGVLNYNLLSTIDNFKSIRPFAFTGNSLTLDARSFSPYGTISQSAIVRSSLGRDADVIRLVSAYSYSDQERLMTYRAGDEITGGLQWTRPIRLGGVQVQSNFALRPDLITAPLPTLGGTAAVPSTVDVYLNNIKTFSQDVGAGPFSLNNVPLISGGGNARVVVRDSSGHETTTSVPFYSSPSLLAPERMSYSFEAGLPRLSFGSTNDTYVTSPVGSATLRRGIFDWLTIEGHAEAGGGVINGGAGAAFRTGTFGVASVAFSASSLDGNSGFQSFSSYETKLFGITISASTQRTYGSYDDLASATARFQNISQSSIQSNYSFFTDIPRLSTQGPFAIYLTAKPPRALDRITFSVPLPFDDKASLGTSLIHLNDTLGNTSEILSVSYSRLLPYRASIFATAFTDLGTHKNTGVFAGLSFPFNDNVSVSASTSSGQGGTTANIEAIKPLGLAPGSIGWRVRDSEGATPYRDGSIAYRSDYARVQVGASQDASGSRGAAELDGSITTMGGGFFLSNRIDDAFAVVNAGVPGVEVFSDNRPVGKTGSNGMLLVPTLRSYQKNKITIDGTNLPVDTEIISSREIVAPADRAGVLVNFDVRKETTSALIVFTRPDGSFVPVGTSGKIEGGGEFVVGYDGQAFIKNLESQNLATIEYGQEACHASFQFAPRPGEQVLISPVICR